MSPRQDTDTHATPVGLSKPVGSAAASAGTTATVCVSGELDLDTAARIAPRLVRSLHDAGRVLALDLGGLRFCDSSGVNLFLRLDRLSRAEGKQLRLQHIPAQPARVLRLLGVHHRLACDFAA
ncbi:STAS domain-containing protein [Kitasatospora hibisci]|uniref:STAS domain-containing protein n=1 Tax=Kitasatospora hibisci TaxID=3369522 RepID=UPI003753F6F9